MKKIKVTEQIHVLGTTFKDIYEIADYSCKEMPKNGVYVGQFNTSWSKPMLYACLLKNASSYFLDIFQR